MTPLTLPRFGCAGALLLIVLSGCGTLPMPFERTFASGTTPAALVAPPAARIVVPPPGGAGLTDEAARRFARALAEAMLAQEVPATTAAIARPDWQLLVAGETEGSSVRLTYSLAGADGQPIASAGGPRPVPAAGWSAGDGATLSAAANEAAPAIARMLTRVEAARRQADPASLAQRLPTVTLPGVTGAPGDGDRALDRAFRDFLGKEGVVVQENGAMSEFTVTGLVEIANVGRNERVEITWLVKRADGLELGKVSQLNEVPRGSLNVRWGDVAAVVAEQAAGGVADVIRRHRGN